MNDTIRLLLKSFRWKLSDTKMLLLYSVSDQLFALLWVRPSIASFVASQPEVNKSHAVRGQHVCVTIFTRPPWARSLPLGLLPPPHHSDHRKVTSASEININMDLLSEQGLRLDGRRADELRNIRCKLGVFSQPDGSAYLEQGNTKVLAAVYGPHQVT